MQFEEIDFSPKYCTLTKDEAYAVAELIDVSLIDTIQNDKEWDSMCALINIINAYQRMCRLSGYVGLTELDPGARTE